MNRNNDTFKVIALKYKNLYFIYHIMAYLVLNISKYFNKNSCYLEGLKRRSLETS